MLLASIASACTQLTNLQANPNSGAAGATIPVTGSNYRIDPASSPGPVEFRLDSRTGPVIASFPVASINPVGRTISLSVTIPAGASLGYHTVLASQVNTTTGALLSGFPVRATYRVTALAGAKESTATAPTEAATAPVAGAEPTTAAATAGAAATSGPASQATSSATAAPTAAAAATVATPVAALPAASAPDPGVNAAAGATTSSGAGPSTPAAAGSSTPALGSTPASVETVTSGLMTAAAEGSASLLPALTLAFGAAIVLLSVAASLKSGRSVLTGRRPTNSA